MILLSDAVGIAAGLALVVAPARDQWARWNSLAEARKSETSVWAAAHRVLSRGWEGHRHQFSGLDSMATAAGALGLTATFVLKMFGL